LFLFFSLFAASIDGFVSGLLIAGMGINFGFKDFLKAFGIIFVCCLAAACSGNILPAELYGKYINIIGEGLMLYLARNALTGNEARHNSSSIYAVSLSVAADAAIVCIYLAACGYDIFTISLVSAVMHAVLMEAGEKISHRIIKHKWELYTRYISAAIFTAMAVYKLSEINI